MNGRPEASLTCYLMMSHVPWNCQRRNYPLWAEAESTLTPEAYDEAKPLLYNAEFAANQYISRIVSQPK